MLGPATSQTLLERLASGDSVSFSEFERRYAPMITSLGRLYRLYDLECEDKDILQGVIACAFRVDSLSVEDMKQVAAFKQLVMNYVKMKKIAAK